MYSTSDFTMGTYLFNAYTGKSGKPTRSYYYRDDTHSQFEYERIWDVLKDKYEERAEGNSYVIISILSVYESDYFMAISKGIDVFQIIYNQIYLKFDRLHTFFDRFHTIFDRLRNMHCIVGAIYLKLKYYKL